MWCHHANHRCRRFRLLPHGRWAQPAQKHCCQSCGAASTKVLLLNLWRLNTIIIYNVCIRPGLSSPCHGNNQHERLYKWDAANPALALTCSSDSSWSGTCSNSCCKRPAACSCLVSQWASWSCKLPSHRLLPFKYP